MHEREIVSQLSKIHGEIQKRQREDKLQRYNSGDKLHVKQMEFHKCNKKNRWVFGGNRTGKTECGAVETVWLARGIHPFRANKRDTSGWVVSLSTQVQRDVAQAKILHYLNKRWIKDIIMISGSKQSPENGVIDVIILENVFGGVSRIGFKSCDQGREKFQGASLDYVWFDEEPPYDIYMECKMRVVDRCGQIFGTMTPLKGLSWVYEEIYINTRNDENVWYSQMSWKDNPFLDRDEVQMLESSLSECELLSRRDGLFYHSGGHVYSEFDENIHVIEPFNVPHDWYDNISIDPGLRNPLSCHWYAVDYDSNVYVIAEHYEENRPCDYHAERIKEISDRLNWHRASNGMLQALIDSAAMQRTLASEKSVVELFYDNGILVNPKVNKDLFSGISRVKSFFKNAEGKPKIFIFKTCVHLILEIKGYFWGNADVPVKRDDHALDELRYYIMSRPETKLCKVNKTPIQRDKEKLFNRIKRNVRGGIYVS